MTDMVCAVVVTHRRPDELAKSLDVLTTQTRMVDHLIVVDNDDDERVRDLVAGQPVPTTYLGSRRNLGGAGGFALGMLHALALGADWVWLADDDGRPEDADVLATLLACAQKHGLAEVSPMVCDLDRSRPVGVSAAPRPGVASAVAELRPNWAAETCCRAIASLFNGALFRAETMEAVGVPDLRLFIRGDEVDVHRRLVLSGLPFGTCLDAVYLHPYGSDEFKPILGGRMHTQYPDDPTKRFFTYRNRGYLQSQRGMRRLVPQEWLRFGWFFLVQRRDPAGFAEWIRLRRLGRRERFCEHMTFTDAAAQSKTFTRAWGDLTRRLPQARAVAAPGLAGHQAALPPLGAGAVLDHHRHRHHRRGDGRAVLQAVSPQAVRASALRDARADHLEPDQRRHPRGRRRVHRQRGPDQTAADAAERARLPAGVAADDPVRAQHRHLRRHRDHLPASRGRGPT